MITINFHKLRNKTMNQLKHFSYLIILLFIINSCGPTYVVQQPAPPPPPPPQPVAQVVAPPPWAPVYPNESQVHYYYLPDIGVYYDVWRQQYIYNVDGQWLFSPALPPSYDWYDINDAYVVVLSYNSYNPWMQHNYYVSSYPAYYYRNNPNYVSGPGGSAGGGYMRGYNENEKIIMYNNRPANPGPRYRNREDYNYNRRPSNTSQPSGNERFNNVPNQSQPGNYQQEQRSINTNGQSNYQRSEENFKPNNSQNIQRSEENFKPNNTLNNQKPEENFKPNNTLNNQKQEINANNQNKSNTVQPSNKVTVKQVPANAQKKVGQPPQKVNNDKRTEEKK